MTPLVSDDATARPFIVSQLTMDYVTFRVLLVTPEMFLSFCRRPWNLKDVVDIGSNGDVYSRIQKTKKFPD